MNLKYEPVRLQKKYFKADTLFFEQINNQNIERFADSIDKRYNLLGIAIYYNNDSILSNNATHSLVSIPWSYISQSITSDSAIGKFLYNQRGKDISIYQTC